MAFCVAAAERQKVSPLEISPLAADTAYRRHSYLIEAKFGYAALHFPLGRVHAGDDQPFESRYHLVAHVEEIHHRPLPVSGRETGIPLRMRQHHFRLKQDDAQQVLGIGLAEHLLLVCPLGIALGRDSVRIVHEKLSGKGTQGVERRPLHRITLPVERTVEKHLPNGQYTGTGLRQCLPVIPVLPGGLVHIEIIREQSRIGMYHTEKQLLGGFMHQNSHNCSISFGGAAADNPARRPPLRFNLSGYGTETRLLPVPR